MDWFVERYALASVPPPASVLDVGSYDVNGSYRELFTSRGYTYQGLDMEAGPNVDIVVPHPYDWSELATDSFDIVVSGQAFEHTEFFWTTMEDMARVLRRDGLLCIVVPSASDEHRYPVDCYRFFTDGLVALARYVGFEVLHASTNAAPSVRHREWLDFGEGDSLLVARKPYSGAARRPDIATYRCEPPDHEVLRGELVPPPVLFRTRLRRLVRLLLAPWRRRRSRSSV